MQYLPLLILLTLVSILSILIDRRRTRQVTTSAAPAATAADSAPASAPPTGVLARLTQQWSQRFSHKPSLPDDPVREWLTTVFVENPAERLWFASLTPEQFKVLRNDLTAFCANLGFDLVWLVEQAPFKPADLEQTGKTIVTHYCRAVRAAVLVHEEMKVLQRYQDFLANPTSKQNLAFGQQLYARLVDEKLTPAAPPELLMATEQERQHFALQAIQAASAAHEVAFSRVLKTVELGALSTPTPAREAGPSAVRNGAVAANSVVA